jgi:arylsulfatase
VAAQNDILPLDWRGPERMSAELTGKPSLAAGRKTFIHETPLAALPEAAAPDLKNKSFTITAEAEIPAGGADGMIFTQGGFTGGWGVYIQQGKLVGEHSHVALERYRVESSGPLPTGKVTLAMDFKYDGGGAAKGGTMTLLANGKKIGEGRIEKTTPFKYALSEGQDPARIPARPSISVIRHRSSSPASREGSQRS